MRKRAAKKKLRAGARLELSHLEKIYFPKEGFTKGDLIAYYDAVAPILLPHLKDRPMVLHRHPNGAGKKGFFQKDTSDLNLPDFVETTFIHSESRRRETRYLLVNNKETLLYAANLGCIELNPWESRTGSIAYPDHYIIDIDPNERPFQDVIETALVTREVLEMACEESYVKTSGKKGLHVYVPLNAKYDYDAVRRFSEMVCQLVNRRLPETTTLEHTPAKRGGRIYLDYLRNGVGQTAAAVYSARPSEFAGVSTPLQWTEVKRGLDPRDFTIKTVPARVEKKGDLWKTLLKKGVDLRAAIKCLEAELGRNQEPSAPSKKRR